LDYNNRVRIDLHIHSTASDGTCTPSEIITTAKTLGLGAIAITDHDTIDGSKEASSMDLTESLHFLTGVEISTAPPIMNAQGSMHILGYCIRLDNPVLNQTLEELQAARKNRNPQIIERLNALGIEITLKEVREKIGEDSQLGRPHIARLMVKKNLVSSINEAFDKYLAAGMPAYVDKFRVDCFKAIEIIQGAGGLPVLAHPILLKTNKGKNFEDMVLSMKNRGLKGIEVYYPEHSADDTAYYIEIAKKFDLLMTGGTDFHGSLKPSIQMGSGKGDLFIPYTLYEKLVEARQKAIPVD